MKLTELIAKLESHLADARTYKKDTDPDVLVVLGRCDEHPEFEVALTLDCTNMKWEVELRVGEPK